MQSTGTFEVNSIEKCKDKGLCCSLCDISLEQGNYYIMDITLKSSKQYTMPRLKVNSRHFCKLLCCEECRNDDFRDL